MFMLSLIVTSFQIRCKVTSFLMKKELIEFFSAFFYEYLW